MNIIVIIFVSSTYVAYHAIPSKQEYCGIPEESFSETTLSEYQNKQLTFSETVLYHLVMTKDRIGLSSVFQPIIHLTTELRELLKESTKLSYSLTIFVVILGAIYLLSKAMLIYERRRAYAQLKKL